MKFIATTVTAILLILGIAQPLEAHGTLRHAGIVVVMDIPTTSNWYYPTRRAVARVDLFVKNYSFRYAQRCPAGRYKCIYIRSYRSPGSSAAAQAFPASA